jgi:predicted dehydrogenase
MEKIKIGIIGAGGISGAHISGYKECDNVELYAVCDINEQRANDKAEEHGFTHVFTDYNEMLKLPELDAVSVCTWNNVHAPATIAALKAGKHVLCEKPMALNSEEAKAMKKVADESGKLLMIGFVRRHGNDAKILKDFIDAGDLGEIYYTKANYIRRYGNPGGWFSDKSRSGGGPLIDLGVHVIDLVRYLSGNPKPVSVYGVTNNSIGNRNHIKIEKGYTSVDHKKDELCDVEDMAAAMIRFDNGMVLNIEVSFSLNVGKNVGTIEIFGTKAGAKIDPELSIYSERNGYLVDITPAHKTALEFNGLFENEIKHFVDCILEKTECIAPAEDGIEIMNILDAIYESAATKKEVMIKRG